METINVLLTLLKPNQQQRANAGGNGLRAAASGSATRVERQAPNGRQRRARVEAGEPEDAQLRRRARRPSRQRRGHLAERYHG